MEFVVDEMGKTTGINVLKGVNSELDTEALRVAKTCPIGHLVFMRVKA